MTWGWKGLDMAGMAGISLNWLNMAGNGWIHVLSLKSLDLRYAQIYQTLDNLFFQVLTGICLTYD